MWCRNSIKATMKGAVISNKAMQISMYVRSLVRKDLVFLLMVWILARTFMGIIIYDFGTISLWMLY